MLALVGGQARRDAADVPPATLIGRSAVGVGARCAGVPPAGTYKWPTARAAAVSNVIPPHLRGSAMKLRIESLRSRRVRDPVGYSPEVGFVRQVFAAGDEASHPGDQVRQE